MSEIRHAVVLGSTGFIGKALYEHLVRLGRGRVVGYSSRDVDFAKPSSLDRLLDVLDTETAVIVAFRARDHSDTLAAFQANVAMVAHLVALLERSPVGKVVYLSSASVYGEVTDNLSINECTPIHPVSFYGIAKYSGEYMLQKAAQARGFPLVVVRPCSVYGPGDKNPQYGPTRFIRSILLERRVSIFGDGRELRDQVYIRDVVEILIRLAFGPVTGVFNLASGQSYTFEQIIEHLRRIVPFEFEVQQQPRIHPFINQKFDIAKLRGIVPDHRFTSLGAGFRETYNCLEGRIA